MLSPARCGGKRAGMLLGAAAGFDLALRLRAPEGATLGEVFAFASGLYFRGKLAYANAFARPPDGVPGALVITPNRGLLPASQPVTRDDLRAFATVDVHPGDDAYRVPLLRAARALAAEARSADVVLLGSIATGKYADVLLQVFEARLRFPVDFVGRGDMSRGGLMLRAVAAGRELEYAPLAGAVRHGPRPPRLG